VTPLERLGIDDRTRRDELSEQRVIRGELSEQAIAQPVEPACRALVDAAYRAGSRDNISAIVVRVCG
jgi:serine/threonine protein phosphatase PrpC